MAKSPVSSNLSTLTIERTIEEFQEFDIKLQEIDNPVDKTDAKVTETYDVTETHYVTEITESTETYDLTWDYRDFWYPHYHLFHIPQLSIFKMKSN